MLVSACTPRSANNLRRFRFREGFPVHAGIDRVCVPLFGTQFVQKPLSPHGGFPVHAGIDPGKNEFADVLEGKRPRERRTAAPAKGGGKGWRLVTIRLDEEVAHRLKVRAAEEDTDVSLWGVLNRTQFDRKNGQNRHTRPDAVGLIPKSDHNGYGSAADGCGRYRHLPTSRSPLPEAVLRLTVLLKKRNRCACSQASNRLEDGRSAERSVSGGRLCRVLREAGVSPGGVLFDSTDLPISSKPSFLPYSSPERAHSPKSLSESFCLSSRIDLPFPSLRGILLEGGETSFCSDRTA